MCENCGFEQVSSLFRWKNNTTGLKEIVFEDVDWIWIAQNGGQ